MNALNKHLCLLGVAVAVAGLVGCGNDKPGKSEAQVDLVAADLGAEAAFIGTRGEAACDGVVAFCPGQFAACVLDDQHYVSGTVPGERKILVSAQSGQTIAVRLYIYDKHSAGTETEVRWYEPGCADEKIYRLSQDPAGGDLFQVAGPDDTLVVQQQVSQTGDHLVSVWSDGVFRYLLGVDVN